MRIIHNLSLSASSEEAGAFSALNILLKHGLCSFRITECDPRWPAVAELVERFNIVDVSWTEFSKSEIETASFLQVLTKSHHGYPEPSEDFGYREVSYDTSSYCGSCGGGLVQSGPLQTKKTSRPRHKFFFQLNWVFDELFVTHELWETIFRNFDIEQQPLLNVRTKVPIPGVVQLMIPQTDIDLDLTGSPKETCGGCGRTKYAPITRGFFPSLMGSTELPLFRPVPHFGSGAQASRAIIMSRDLYGALKDVRALKGLAVAPLATEGSSKAEAS